MPRDRRITDCDGLLREARRRGAEIEKTTNGHYKIIGPAGMAVISPKWGDPRDRHNAVADVRRHAGIDVTDTPDNEPEQQESTVSRPASTAHPATTAPEPAQVTRADHDTLLAMLAEQASTIEKLTAGLAHASDVVQRLADTVDDVESRLGVTENSVDALATEIAGMPMTPHRAEDAWITELRTGIAETLGRFGASYVPRMTVAEALEMLPATGKAVDADALALRRLSYVLMMMRDEGTVESIGAKSATRWRLTRKES